ncbi:SIR2 family protein [Mucilaginibacter gotjawali]|uniref:Uncharacterized protein n=2 Tax=Mucilaginibacter gotjawali TaxID=1550579 RepID=A0A120MZ77_9SPHI|nr:SIR2 family protein [Mucilaginibacter gotjawali]MBB3058733.1 cell division septum initiation protein DivIVA [Mucilaginibacter gotjawali]BAU55663.1 hypothetical protein MgSA37_03854 [Mucilaginibacter gotjawali]
MNSAKPDYLKQLKDLRNKLASDQMSLLVGSGLSKNASTKFLTWDELLIDLAYELNERHVNSAFDRYTAMHPVVPLEEADFRKQECLHLIREQGYLEIVSAYMKRKAIPESITTYIEERIPAVYPNGDEFIMDCNGVTEPLGREKLALHKSLINDLPWNNIYTTNYDDLLDICIDNSRYDRLQSEIHQLEEEITPLEQNIRKKEKTVESLNQTPLKPEVEEREPIPIEGLEPVTHDAMVKADLQTLAFEIRQLQSSLQQKELLLAEKNREAEDCYQVVKTAAGLRIKKRKNIIKLHGSLRSASERERFHFEFDGDHKKQYVISKEDYENYPKEHEAFTQLMRISLLQESFCLIGFSGVDPNFLQWINWVRDILFKAARLHRNDNRYKIYLIDTGEGDVPADKQLFYENHNIVRIPLRDPDVIKVFTQDLGADPMITDRASAIQALISFLGNDDHIKPDIPTADISVRREHRQLWDGLRIFDPNELPEEEAIAPMLGRLTALNEHIWLPDLSYASTHNQHSLLGYINFENWNRQLPQRPLLRQLVILALKDMAVPIRSFLEMPVIEQLAAQPENKDTVEQAISRNDALSAVEERRLLSEQDTLLQLAYTFQFTKLKTYLEEWAPGGRQQIIKAGFLALYDRQAAGDGLAQALAKDSINNGEEKLYALEQLHHITQPFLLSDKRISRQILAYERSGYHGLQSRMDDLQKLVAKKAQEIKPYGENRMNRTRSLRLSKHSEAEAAVQILMLLAESGFQMSIRNIYLLSSEDWYPVMKAGFEFYPMPFLFYSLQYSKKEFLKKAGQDYAFSTAANVSEQLPAICCALFKNLKSAPVSYTDHIQVFLSTLIIGVSPGIWQHDFFKWWRALVNDGIAYRKDHVDTHPGLVIAAIQYVDDPHIIEQLISDWLKAVLAGEVDQPINFLYHLNKNLGFKAVQDGTQLSTTLGGQIDAVIAGIDTANISRIFVLGNLFRLLTPEQQTAITSRLMTVDFQEVSNARIWRILLHFANGQPILDGYMRKALLNHRNLWYTGINGNQISGGLNDEPIPVSSLSFSEWRPNGLQWDDSELELLYSGLQASLANIERLAPAPDFWFTFTPVLEEMVDFLKDFISRIASYEGYEDTLARAIAQLNIHRKYTELEEGLTSRDENAVETALHELDLRVYKDAFENDNVVLVMNKILLQAEPAVEASLGFLTSWLFYKRYPNRFRDQESLLVRILRKYELQPPDGGDVAYIEEKLVRIAWRLHAWQCADPVVNRWLEKAAASRFNNVRQFLASVRGGDENTGME